MLHSANQKRIRMFARLRDRTYQVTVASILVVSACLAAITLTPAAASSTGTETTASAPTYTGFRYWAKNVCVWDVQNSSEYDVAWEASTWEAGTAGYGTGTVNLTYRTSAQGCADFPQTQVMRIMNYSEPDGSCSTYKAYLRTTNPTNPHYTYVFDDGMYPTVYINQWYYAACREGATMRQHQLGMAMGRLMGLNAFADNDIDAVMNTNVNKWKTIAGAWAHDRNRLFSLMYP